MEDTQEWMSSLWRKKKYFLAFLSLSQHAGFKLMWVWDPSRLYYSLSVYVSV